MGESEDLRRGKRFRWISKFMNEIIAGYPGFIEQILNARTFGTKLFPVTSCRQRGHTRDFPAG